MGQRRPAETLASRLCLCLSVLLFQPAGCRKQSTPAATAPATPPTLASLVPAATDLVIGMGARDRLVAVSTYDAPRSDVGGLPKAGDYNTVDWELLASLHPSVMCTAISADLQPKGFKDRADALRIKLIDVNVGRLADIDTAIDRLGAALQVEAKSTDTKNRMHARLEAVRRRVGGLPPVSVLVFIDSAAANVAGPANYLDDLLQLAGGTNAAAGLSSYAQIDREQLIRLNPGVIIQLLPMASPQEKQKASEVWKQLPRLTAVAGGRVYPIYDEYALLPGWHVTDLAEKFAECLHPTLPSSPPTSPPSPPATSPARP